MLPPSLHESGRSYAWKNVTVLAPFDSDLFEEAASSGSASASWSDEVLQGVPQGSRSVTAARLAGKYFGLGLSLDETRTLMVEWNKRNMPPLEMSDLHRTVRGGGGGQEAGKTDPVQIDTLEQLRNLLGEE